MTPKKHDERRLLAHEYIGRYGLSLNNLSRGHLSVLYHTMKLPQQIIADELGCTLSTVRRRMSKYGIKGRKNAETKSARLNQDFFKTWSPAMAWALGLIFTDAYFSKATHVKIASIDLDILEKVKALICPYRPIQQQRQSYDKTKKIYMLTFGNNLMATDLRALGLTMAKSKVMPFPDVPEEFIRHFIRGCWDGDGGLTISKGKAAAHYTCGSKGFIDRIALELYEAGIVRKILRYASDKYEEMREKYGDGPYPLRVYERTKQPGSYDLRTGGDNIKPLFDFFYSDVDESIYMKRKHDKFLEAIRLTAS